MTQAPALAQLPELLLPWYEENKRSLPWRKDREPYHIWISEIMLQQTRVEAVKGYYARFLEALPDVHALAVCPDDALHKLWEGLGYYSRVRNLKKAAGVILSDFGGQFPKSHREVLSLPGIGDYTAGAICSIAYGLPTPAVDGNVLRLLSRLLNDPTPIDLPDVKKQARELLAEIYPSQAGAFTQALMELGATLCGPNRAPECETCPCRSICQAYREGTAGSLPVKQGKKERKVEEKTVFVLCNDGRYALEKRPDKGLLASLWQFPNVPGKLEINDAMGQLQSMDLAPRELHRQLERSHIFTHIIWNMRCYWVSVDKAPERFTWMTPEEIRTGAALPTAFRQFWEETAAL